MNIFSVIFQLFFIYEHFSSRSFPKFYSIQRALTTSTMLQIAMEQIVGRHMVNVARCRGVDYCLWDFFLLLLLFVHCVNNVK